MDEKKSHLLRCCSHDSGNCPTAEITEEEVFIRDDFGGEVRLSRPQFQILLDKAQALKEIG
jgi:hypothetical protein